MPTAKEEQPPRIGQEAAIKLMDGIISRSGFFELLKSDPDLAVRLDRRINPDKRRNAIHYDRQQVVRWIREVAAHHSRAIGPSENAGNLGAHATHTDTRAESYGDRLAVLCAALDAGRITREQFERALADLEARS